MPSAAPAERQSTGADVWSSEHLAYQEIIFPALDQTVSLASTKGYDVFVRELMDLLDVIKAEADPDVWHGIVVPVLRRHDLQKIVHACPFSRHSFTRPRGYPGDADMLDLVYRHPAARPIIDGLSATGRAVFDVTTGVTASEAVRQRRQVIARRIDRVAEERPGAEILAVACGHLRELEFSEALRSGRIGRLIATDQDRDSLAVAQTYAESLSDAISTQPLSVKDFIAGRHDLRSFDFIYAAGLYDYLDDRVAMRLTRKLFALLKPGGRLLVPNLLVGIPEVAYMEAYMDWHMIYRTEAEIRAFAAEISELDIGALAYYQDETDCIGYLEIERA